MRIALALAAVLVATTLGGCIDWLDGLNRPDIPVSRTDLSDTNEQGYITQSRFSVVVQTAGGAAVDISATSSDDQRLAADGHSDVDTPVAIDLPDGTWTVTYHVDGHKWETFKNVRIDATPPDASGIDAFGAAQDGRYTIGSGHTREEGVSVVVKRIDGQTVANGLPATITGLNDGIHSFIVLLEDPAGNRITVNVAVTAGDAKRLPQGQYTFGIVARYSNEARLWDLSDMDAYLSPADAADAVQGRWLGSGFAITPEHPEVQQVASQAVSADDTSMEAAWKLYRWLFENLEYTEERLAEDDLLEPAETFANGGGVCRDLAAAYVSLLRAAGVPARLVSGYLAGEVNGFHAWAEVYVGAQPGNPGPWMPIDVSPIDGRWHEPEDRAVPHGQSVSMQAFGIQLPNYLALRTLPEQAEVEGWSTALGTSFTYPGGSQPPEASFEKRLSDEAHIEGLLCFHKDTLERRLASSTSQCGSGWYIIGRDLDDEDFKDKDPFVTATQRIIDYGVEVLSAPQGSEITMRISYPFEDALHPDDSVSWVTYDNRPSGYKFHQESPDPATGAIEAVLTR